MAGRGRPAAEWLDGVLAGPLLVQALAVAARLAIFELVRDGPRSPLVLASTAGVHPGALTRLLRYLAAEGVLAPTADGQFGPTPRSEALLRGARGEGLERLLRLASLEWDVLPGLLGAVETGQPAAAAPAQVLPAPPPEAIAALRRLAGTPPGPVAVHGSEALTTALAGAWPAAPPPGDALAAWVVLDGLSALDDRGADDALVVAHGVLPPGGRVFALEPVAPPDPRADPGLARADLRALVLGAGRIRTLEEWQRLFERAGLRLDAASPVRCPGGWRVLAASRGLV
ncbi:hypothetical protein [Tepidiforma sp.]|uniref:methyltransferase family protein n=1 Tax=Tepidiforma sp. TaxID=2682230 RepID=UPI002ADE5AC4|nr:hypothetical protein [Tepidiforma sp.]